MATLLTKPAIAIEIRWHALGASTGRFGHSPTESITIAGSGTPNDWQGLSDGLRSLSEGFSAATPNCRVGLPPEEFMIRSVRLPFHDPRRIRMVLPMAVDPLVPDPVEELALSFTSVPVADGTLLTVAAIPKVRLQQYEAALESAGLRAQLITIGGAAAAINAEAPSPADRFVIQRVADSLTVYAVSAKGIVGMRSITLPPSPHEGGDDAVLSALGQIVAGLHIAMPGFNAEQMILMGEIAAADATNETLKDSFDIPVTPFNPRTKPDAPLTTMAEALLAVRGRWPHWNYQKRQRPVATLWRHHRRHVLAMAVVLMLLVCVGLTNYGADIYFLRKKTAKLDQYLDTIYRGTFPNAPSMGYPQNMMDMKNRIARSRQTTTAGDTGTVPIRAVDILAVLVEAIPETQNVSLTRFTVEGARLTVAGTAGNFNTVNAVRDRLAQSDHLSETTIVTAEQDGKSKQVRFSLRAKVTP